MSGLFVVRQPVYTRTQHVFGYELKFQSVTDIDGHVDTHEERNSLAALDALIEIGFDDLVSTRTAFLPLSREFLVGGLPLPLPCDRTVICLSDYDLPDQLFLGTIDYLGGKGYRIALDNLMLNDPITPLMEFADVVIMDIQALDQSQLQRQVRVMKHFGNIKMMARGVTTEEEYQTCRGLGFVYFDGDYFATPRLVNRRRLAPNKLALVKLLAELQRSDARVQQIENLVSNDVALSYKLLRYINSAFFGLPRPVESIQRAIVFLGLGAIQKWASMLIMSRNEDKPTELMVSAVTRARMCELLAQDLGYEGGDIYFTVGLLSVLDALLDMPMAEVLKHLSLSRELNQALTQGEGPAGKVLYTVLSYEAENWVGLDLDGLSAEQVRTAYLGAVNWANEAGRMLSVE